MLLLLWVFERYFIGFFFLEGLVFFEEVFVVLSLRFVDIELFLFLIFVGFIVKCIIKF